MSSVQYVRVDISVFFWSESRDDHKQSTEVRELRNRLSHNERRKKKIQRQFRFHVPEDEEEREQIYHVSSLEGKIAVIKYSNLSLINLNTDRPQILLWKERMMMTIEIE
jgi:hypothetical protein